MGRLLRTVDFTCVDCGELAASIRWLPDTRTDPGCLEQDPPDCCEACGGEVVQDSPAEPVEPDEPDERPDPFEDWPPGWGEL